MVLLLTTGKGQAWHWASLLHLLLPGAWDLCQMPDPGSSEGGMQGGCLGGRAAAAWSMFLLVAEAAAWAQLSDPVLLQWPKGWAKASDRGQRNCPFLV